MSKDKFLRGAMILTMAGLMVKVIGSVNRILLSRLLGGEGIGLYQMAYPVYLLLLAISSAGIPIAISIIVSGYLAKDDYRSVRRVFSVSLRLMAGVGAVLALLLFIAANYLVDSDIIRDGRAYYALTALIPAIFFATILATFRGFFQGHQLMTPPAVSQIIEQFIRVVTMVLLAYLLLPYGLEFAAAGAAFGAVPGSLTGLIVLGFFYRYYRYLWQRENSSIVQSETLSTRRLIKRLLWLALPVSCANVLVPVTSSIDAFLVPGYLIDSGFSIEQSTTLYGYLAGMAQPLILMATIPTMSLATSIVPAIAESFALQQHEVIKQKAATAIKICCLLTLPAAVGMSVLAENISLLLYGTVKAATAIMHSGPAIWFLGMQQVTTAILQGMGHTTLPMVNMLLGIGAKLMAVCVLTNAEYNIAGAAWATNINFALTALLNILALYRCRISFGWLKIIKIMVAAIVMGAFTWLVAGCELFWSKNIATIIALGSAVACYALLLPLLGIINRSEMQQLPLVKKFFKSK